MKVKQSEHDCCFAPYALHMVRRQGGQRTHQVPRTRMRGSRARSAGAGGHGGAVPCVDGAVLGEGVEEGGGRRRGAPGGPRERRPQAAISGEEMLDSFVVDI